MAVNLDTNKSRAWATRTGEVVEAQAAIVGVIRAQATEALYYWREQVKDASASTFLLLLIIADCAFLLLDATSRIVLLSLISDEGVMRWELMPQIKSSLNLSMFSLAEDNSYPEFFQYTKELWIVVLLTLVCVKSRAVGFAVWALLFAYLLLDDSLQIHETFGAYIARSLNFSSFAGLRPVDFGEFIVYSLVAASFLSLLSWVYIRGSDAFKSASRHLLLLLCALAFFGVVVDMLDVALRTNRYVDYAFAALEDGGEMIIMSFITWYVFLLKLRGGVPQRGASL